MVTSHRVEVRDRRTGETHVLTVPEGRPLLEYFEEQGIELPFACRQGACTTCAVRVLAGDLAQREAMGLAPALQQEGYALFCVARAQSAAIVETQDEDEVYRLQFGRAFAQARRPWLRFPWWPEDD
ncbi:MAG: 2Fe-2S iron-sulfur cluster binding domain-containing protein [Oscillatoriales cyanobacterium SM2_1_8]|nr:2Fe-2S iron-sulfur cluster binding domain-containing protein [Oscillatoriales cyanobacterium SM2_1_8]